MNNPTITTMSELKSQLPDYAKDIKLNLSKVLSEEGAPGLSLKQIYGTALASAYATKNAQLAQALRSEASGTLSGAEINAAQAAATIMAMNNIYYRFIHLTNDKTFGEMPANLRMQIIANPGIEKTDFEIYALAVSAINGCGMCMDAHIHTLLKHGISKEGAQSALRIAAVINAAAQALVIDSLE